MRITHILPSLALAGALLAGAPTNAEIYRWTDADGRLHFTERLEMVPLEHRERAVRSALESSSHEVQTFSAPSSDAFAEIPAGPAVRPRRSARSGGSVRIPFQRDGSLMRVDVRLNDVVTAPFLIDTGASGVSLPSRVAEQLGIRVRPDTPHVQVRTANGVVSRALVKLDSVEVAGARVEGLEATVNPSMDIGLLGGSFFNNFVYRVDAAESVITLMPNEQIRGGMGEYDWRRRFRGLLDPIAKLDAHLAEDVVRRKGELERLRRRRVELEQELEELGLLANRLDVPQTWRQ